MSSVQRESGPVESIDTVVIGAGQAGLSASWCLRRQGIEHVVLERGRVGERWRSERWDGFYLNTPNWALRLPGFHYAGPRPDAFASLPETIAYLEDYARSFQAPVREETPVQRVRRDGAAFLVDSPAATVRARNVVVAAGAYQHPTPSPLAHALPADVVSLHTSEYRRPAQLPEGAVAIVGSGQSGCQVAEELLRSGRRVFLFVSRCTWLPRRYRGRDLMSWMIESGLADQTVDLLPTPAARLACNAPVSGNDGGHDCNPRTLAREGAILLGRLESVEGGILRAGDTLAASLAAGDEAESAFRGLVDHTIATRGLEAAAPEGLPEREPYAALSTRRELDLRGDGVGAVIWANGFRPDHSWIEGVEADPLGWPKQERGAATLPGLYFVGLHWLHKRKSALLLGVGEDAEHVASCIAKAKTATA